MRVLILIISFLVSSCGNTPDAEVNCCGISAIINLKSIPNEITYGGGTDLVYSVTFDINNNQIFDEGDLIFSINHISWTNDTAVTIPSSSMEAYIWTINAGGTTMSRYKEISLETTNTSIKFIAKDIDHENISLINSGTQIYVYTTFTEPVDRKTYFDYYPAKNTFTVGLDTSYINDNVDDIESIEDSKLTQIYSQIDITSIEIKRL